MHTTTPPYERIEPDDCDLGDEVTNEVIIHRPTGVVISVRLTREEADWLAALARRNGTGVVEAARATLSAALQPATGRTPTAPLGAPEGQDSRAPGIDDVGRIRRA